MVGSAAGRQPIPLHAVYSATKAFDLFLGEALYVEMREQGIDVLVVEPGSTQTEFQRGRGRNPAFRRYAGMRCGRCFGKPWKAVVVACGMVDLDSRDRSEPLDIPFGGFLISLGITWSEDFPSRPRGPFSACLQWLHCERAIHLFETEEP